MRAESTGIDTRILQDQDFCNNANNLLAFSFFFVVFFSSFGARKTRVLCQDVVDKITVLHLLFSSFGARKTRVLCQDVGDKITALHLLFVLLVLQQRFLLFTLYLQKPRRSKMTTLDRLITRVM